MAQLQAQVQSSPRPFSEIQQDPLYINADASQQALAAQEYFNQYVATQSAYKQAKPEQQKAAFDEFVTQYNIPMPQRQPITAGQPMGYKPRPMLGIPAGFPGGPAVPAIEVSNPQAAQDIQRRTGQGAALFLNDYAKGLSFGYLDPNKLAGDPLQRQTLMQNPAMQNLATAGELGGSLAPIELAAGAGNQLIKGLGSAGSRLALNPNVPRYLQGAATKAVPVLRGIEQGLQKIGPLGRDMLEQAAAFGGYEGLKAREGQDQFDPLGRLQSAAVGAGIGALFPALGAAGKNVITGAREIFRPQTMPTGLGQMLQGSVQKTVTEPAVKLLEGLERDFASLMEDIHANDLAQYVTEGAINRLSTIKDRITRSAAGVLDMTLGEVRSHRSTLTKIRRELKGRAQAQGKTLRPAAEISTVEKEAQKQRQATTAPIIEKVARTKKEAEKLQAEVQQLETELTSQKDVPEEIEVTEYKLTAEVQKKVDAIKKKYVTRKQRIKAGKEAGNGSVYDSKERQLQAVGMQEAAEIRRAIQGDSLENLSKVGGLTESELAAKIQKESTNYAGKRVLVNGRAAVVNSAPFGKVKVTFEDGTTAVVAKDAVKPVGKKQGAPTVEKVTVTKPNPDAVAQAEKRKQIEAEIQKRKQKIVELETQAAEAEKTLAAETQPTAEAVKPEGKPEKKLTGSIQQMVDAGLEDSGLTLNEARQLTGEVQALGKADDDAVIVKLKEQRKALGNKRDDATKEAKAKIDAQIQVRKDERQALRDKAGTINSNLRSVLSTDWDGVSAVANQLPVAPTQLKGEAVKSLITDPKELKVFEAVDHAAQQGKTVKVRHVAEETGSTDATAKVTGKGNVIVPLSEFTPTHFEIVTKGDKKFVTAIGYNEAGHESRYYITKSPNGSYIQEVKGSMPEQFVGVTPNVYLPDRKYKVADVLGREVRQEGILTSEAKNVAQAAKDLFESDTFKQLSPQVQKLLKQINKRGRFESGEMRYVLDKMNKDKKQLEAFCNLFGI